MWETNIKRIENNENVKYVFCSEVAAGGSRQFAAYLTPYTGVQVDSVTFSLLQTTLTSGSATINDIILTLDPEGCVAQEGKVSI